MRGTRTEVQELSQGCFVTCMRLEPLVLFFQSHAPFWQCCCHRTWPVWPMSVDSWSVLLCPTTILPSRVCDVTCMHPEPAALFVLNHTTFQQSVLRRLALSANQRGKLVSAPLPMTNLFTGFHDIAWTPLGTVVLFMLSLPIAIPTLGWSVWPTSPPSFSQILYFLSYPAVRWTDRGDHMTAYWGSCDLPLFLPHRGGKNCSVQASRVCQSSQQWSNLFIVIMLMAHNYQCFDVQMLHRTFNRSDILR